MSVPLVIAHRGDSSRALENSLAAVRLALDVPADMIELDIRKSRDNRLYVMHDKDTGRTAGKNIDLERSTSDEIERVTLTNGEAIPTLEAILSLVAGKADLNLEIKSEGAGALCAAKLAGCGYPGALLLSSFREQEVLDARRVLPKIRVSGIFDDFAPTEVKAYQANGYRFLSLRKNAVTRELVALCHASSIQVYVWTVNEENEMKKFISLGVDGIYSNTPALLKKVTEGRI